MNDKLRFRVWDKVFNEYWTDEQIKENAGWLLFPDNANINDIEIEKCTGKKDKNEKLIYEGDLFEPIYDEDFPGETVEVIWHKETSGFKVRRKGRFEDWNGLYYEWRKYEEIEDLEEWLEQSIIGNIHENPELLEK